MARPDNAILGLYEFAGAADTAILGMARACGGNIARTYEHDATPWCALTVNYFSCRPGFRVTTASGNSTLHDTEPLEQRGGGPILGHADRDGDPPVAGSENVSPYQEAARSWNAAHTSRSCSQPDLVATGGNDAITVIDVRPDGAYHQWRNSSATRRGSSNRART